MNRFFTLLLVMGLAMIAGNARAELISENQAKDIATGFMASHKMMSTNLEMARRGPQLNASTTGDQAAYYVFNANRGGYIIVAGDDRAPAVLGYSDHGSFDEAQVPEAMQELLESYVLQIEALTQGAKAAPQFSAGSAIRPLLSSAWSQNAPYNTLLPSINGSHCPAGCVATAMAQVLYYWKWPTRPTKTIPQYTSADQGFVMPALSPVNFGWNIMHDTYQTTDTTSASALAAATLTLYCAQSVEMNFKANSSAATTTRIPLALSEYFGYKASVHSLNRVNYTTQEWADAIYSELAANRPVIYSGSKKSSGHAFICDGYDGNGLFHINWGWSGQSNGYFVLNVLNPDIQGTGSATGAYGYIYSQSIIVGIEPGEDVFGGIELTSANVTLDSYTSTRTASNYAFSATVSGRFYNYTSQVIAVNFGWGLYQGETLKSVLYNAYNTSLRPGSYLSSNSRPLSFGKDITSGTYRIVPIYSEYGANNWQPCVGADRNYIEVTINGNTCTFMGHGTAGQSNYTVNSIRFEGNMHNGRPVDIIMNLTNNGESSNQLLHMFVNNTFTASSFVGLEKSETGDIPFRYLPSAAGTYTLTFSFNEDGSNPIATRQLTINAMPTANLSGSIQVLNITDANNKIVTSKTFSILVTITNNGTTQYDEDISVKLFKNTHDNSGNTVQAKNQHLVLAPGATTTMQFDMDNVIDGWRYFAYAYYYSAGTQTTIKGTTTYTVVFPDEPEYVLGDVNDDGSVNISDVTSLIDYLLNSATSINTLAADLNGDGAVNISDVTALIDMLLAH